MKVIVTNRTGSGFLEATLTVESGVLVFDNGEVSHIVSEKHLGKTITVVTDSPERTEVKRKAESQDKIKRQGTK